MIKRIFGLFAPALVAGFLLATGAQAQNCTGSPNANTVCAGPASGGSGFPNFRSLVPADIAPVANATLANMAAGTVKANPTGSSAAPTDWAINASTSVEGTGINGLDGPQFFIFNQPASASTPSFSTFRADRKAQYTGGTFGNVYSGIQAISTTGANVTNFEWAFVGEEFNSATAGENGGILATGFKVTPTAGITWGGNLVVDDQSGAANPSSGSVGAEIDNYANGTDSNSQRVVLAVVGGKHGGTGTTPTITWGWLVEAQNQVLTNATFVHGGYFHAATYTDLIGSNSSIVTTNGIDFTQGTFSGSPFKSAGFAVDNAGNVTANNLTSAWAAFTPTATCGTATFTVTSSRARTVGKTTFIEADFTISGIGTCIGPGTTPFTFTLPNTANSSGSMAGFELTTKAAFVCTVAPASTTATCFVRNGGAPLVNDHYVASGVYENQ